MKNLLKILFFLVYFLLTFSNQRQFSILADNLIPVRIILLGFLVVGFIYFTVKEKVGSFRYFWDFLKKDRIFLLSVMLFLWRALSLTQASDVKFGLVMLMWWGSIISFYFLGSWLVEKLEVKSVALYGLLLGVAVSVLVAIYQTVSFVGWGIQRFDLWGWQYPDGFRVPGLMLDSNHFGIFMVAGFFVTTWFFLSRRRYPVAALSSFLTLGAYSLSSSRSALLGLLAGSVFLVVALLVKKEFKTLGAFLVILAIGLSSGTAISKAIEIYTNNYVTTSVILHQEVSDKNLPTESVEFAGIFSFVNDLLPSRVRRVFDASAKSHLEMLNASWNLGLRYPLLGVGLGNFAEGLRSQPDLYASALQFDARGLSVDHFPSHTLWGEQLAETGFIGLIIYTLLVMAILGRILKTRSSSNLFFGAVWMAFLVFSVFYTANEEFFWLIPFLGIWL